MRARWRLGKLLTKLERGRPGRNRVRIAPYMDYLKKIGLEKKRALEAQRIAALAEKQLDKELIKNRSLGNYTTFGGLLVVARPHWYKASRKR
jgi:hypothetical protein